MSHVFPEAGKAAFCCIHCGAFANQEWYQCFYRVGNSSYTMPFSISLCVHCNSKAYWYESTLVLPRGSYAELPALDMPDSCKEIFLEARDVADISPKAAAALLRLCVQKLMIEFGKPGKNLNSDIGALVQEGLPPLVQKSLDICRVIGNNAVHPGEINLNDTPEIANTLFKLINFVVHDRITRPKEIEALYESLPSSALEQIDRRDTRETS